MGASPLRVQALADLPRRKVASGVSQPVQQAVAQASLTLLKAPVHPQKSTEAAAAEAVGRKPCQQFTRAHSRTAFAHAQASSYRLDWTFARDR